MAFTLEKYLSTIKVNKETLTVSIESLSRICFSHLKAFPYSNRDIYHQGLIALNDRKPVPFNLDFIYNQFIEEKSPGYCFQTTELLFAALFELGFKVARHLSKVCNQSMENIEHGMLQKKCFDHDVLIVDIEGRHYLVDPGFANNSLRNPVELKEGEQIVAGDSYRLSKQEDNWYLEMGIKQDQWLCLYQFQAGSSTRDEIEEAHNRLFFDENHIPIRDDFQKYACVTEDKRKQLVLFKENGSCFFKSFNKNQIYKQKTVNKEEYDAVVQQKFTVGNSSETEENTVQAASSSHY